MLLQIGRKRLPFGIALLVTFVFLIIGIERHTLDSYAPLDSYTAGTQGKEIYATLLTGQKNSHNETDFYYNATRVLVHRLLVHPSTKDSRPVVVFVTPDVLQYKRDRLSRDGAIVREIAAVSFLQAIGNADYDWLRNDTSRTEENQGARVFRWKDQMTKLQLFNMTEYDKIVCK